MRKGIFTTPEEFPCSGLPTEDFEKANLGVVPLMANPLDKNTNNGIFSTGEILPGIILRSSVNNLNYIDLHIANSGTYAQLTSVAVFPQNSLYEYLIIQFTDDNVTNVSMKVINLNLGNINIEIFGNDGSLGITTVYGPSAGTFWGVQSMEPIKEIHLNSTTSQGEGVDDISFGICNPDSDGDGCPDTEDAVIFFNMEEFVNLDGCSKGVPNRMTLSKTCGTMMSDVIDGLGKVTYKNHGEFLKTISKVINEWYDKKLITLEEKTTILSVKSFIDLLNNNQFNTKEYQ